MRPAIAVTRGHDAEILMLTIGLEKTA